MSYELEAFLATTRAIPGQRGKETPYLAYPLTDSLVLVPLVGAGENAVSDDWPRTASRAASVARVSASYFGGAGSQSATVWTDGEMVAENVDVNEALRRLGVVAQPGQDEWDTVGLGRFRKTATWAAQAIRERRKRRPDPLPELLAALRYTCADPDQQQKVRAGAAHDLGDLGLHNAIPELVAAVETRGEYGLRIAAASALARIGGDGIAELARLLEDREAPSRRQGERHRFIDFGPATWFLTRLGQAGVMAAAKLLNGREKMREAGDATYLWPIVHALGEAGKAAAPAAGDLVRVLRHGSGQLRRDAAHALGKIGPSDAQAVPALLLTLEDEDKLVRAAAAEALGQVAVATDEAVPHLLHALADEYDAVRKNATKSLVAIGGTPDPAVVPAMIDLLRDPFSEIAGQAVDSLGEIGAPARSAVAVLVALLRDGSANEYVRARACTALARIDPESHTVLQVLIDATREESGSIACSAALALGALRPAAPEIVSALMEVLRRPVPVIALRGAVSTLAGLGPAGHDAVPALIALARHENPDVREAVALAIEQIGS